MRFRELYLKAFGPFSERRVVFPEDGPESAGLIVIHGRNEAGKSSALRAIRGFLYGIPLRSADDFVHRHKDMRVGARIVFADGEELAAIRRKGNRDTLRAFEDDRDPVAAERLVALTQRVPEALFENFYGLDHRALTQGSKALLEDEGELGRALFGAGLGAGNLRAVLESLDREAGELFNARGSKPRINAALAAWKANEAEIKAEALRPQAWEDEARRVAEAEAELEALGESVEETSRALSRLRRIKLALPPLARRQHWQQQQAGLPEVASLREDFEDRLRTARADRREAEQARERAVRLLERQAARREALRLAPELLEARERIELLHRGVTGYRETLDQLPRRESELARLDAEIEDAFETIDAAVGAPTDALDANAEPPAQRSRALRAVRDRSPRIQELASELAGFETRLAAAKDELAEAETETRRLCERLEAAAAIGDPEPLRRALARATRLGDVDARIAAEERAVEALADGCARSLDRLAIGEAGRDELERTSFPTDEAIDAFAERFETGAQAQARIDETRGRLANERADVDESLARLEGERDVPSEADLAARRSAREEAWQALRRDFVEAATQAGAEDRRRQADHLDQAIGAADEVADRLRIDADRVARHSALQARRARLEVERAAADAAFEAARAEAEALAADWADCWRVVGVEPRSVDEMRSWQRGLAQLLENLGALREARGELAARVAEREQARGELVVSLATSLGSSLASDLASGPGDRLDRLVDRAQDALAEIEEAVRSRHQLGEALEQARLRSERGERDRERALRALDDWRAEWSAAIEGLGLAASERPKEALARLDAIRRLVDTLREREQLADRIEKMRANAMRFEQEAAALVAACVPSLSELAAEPTVLRLSDLLSEARDQDVHRVEIEQALAEARDEREQAEANGAAATALLAALCVEAEVTQEEAIDETLRNWKRQAEARAGLREAEERLVEIGEGRSIETLAEECRDLDPDALEGQIESLEGRLAEQNERRDRAIAELRSLRDALAVMDGSGRVAELAEQGQAMLATIRRDAERYLELRLAREILEREIDVYRQRNQAPVLKRAGEIFGLLTRAAYPNIVTDAGEPADGRGGARLMAVTAAGAEVPVEGLSSGTRDQLYLALRLATLEESLDRARGEVEPMPLIADDILVEFDDDRSRATLEVLAQVARKTQILLFSHHLHVADAARDLGSSAHVVEL